MSEQRSGYVGWVEFTKDGGSTTHIAYLYEHGEPYFPEGGLTEWDLRAAEAAGRMWPLIRTDWATESDPERISDADLLYELAGALRLYARDSHPRIPALIEVARDRAAMFLRLT